MQPVVGDTWWATSIDLDRSGETQDLTQSDREVAIEVKCTDAAGRPAEDTVSRTITWKVTVIGDTHEARPGGPMTIWSRPATVRCRASP